MNVLELIVTICSIYEYMPFILKLLKVLFVTQRAHCFIMEALLRFTKRKIKIYYYLFYVV